MKHLIALSILFLAYQGIAQNKTDIHNPPVLKPVALKKRQVAVKKQIPIEKEISSTSKLLTLRPQFGDYKVAKYYILRSNVPSGQELNLIMGSLIKVQDKLISGEEIDPRTYSFTTNESMTRSDFITAVFGREIRAQEPDIPEQLVVHKTDNEACFGIIQIDAETIAFPYQGVLLILKKI